MCRSARLFVAAKKLKNTEPTTQLRVRGHLVERVFTSLWSKQEFWRGIPRALDGIVFSYVG